MGNQHPIHEVKVNRKLKDFSAAQLVNTANNRVRNAHVH